MSTTPNETTTTEVITTESSTTTAPTEASTMMTNTTLDDTSITTSTTPESTTPESTTEEDTTMSTSTLTSASILSELTTSSSTITSIATESSTELATTSTSSTPSSTMLTSTVSTEPTTITTTTVTTTVTPTPTTIVTDNSTTATTKPSLIPPDPPEYYQYPVTSDYHFPLILRNASACSPAPNDIEHQAGPFGFGGAIKTNECCPKLQNFSRQEHKSCFHQPAECLNGFSFSIWEKIVFTAESSQKRYILSTGGDERGHSGIGIYHQGVDLHAIVSNGTHYWNVTVFGPVENGSWANIGLIWSDQLGMELYVNGGKPVASIKHPFNQEAVQMHTFDTSVNPEVIVGCRLDKTTKNLTENAVAFFDELAIWMNVVNDSEYFLGGFNPAAANFTLEKILRMLKNKNSDLLSKDNLPALVKLVQKMTKGGSSSMEGSSKKEGPRDTNGIEVILNEEQPENQVQITTPSLEELHKRVKELSTAKNDPHARAHSLQMVSTIIKVLSNVQFSDISQDEFSEHLGLLDIVSNVFGPQYTDDWKNLQKKTSPDESMLMVNALQKWAVNILSQVPLNEDGSRFRAVKTTPNLVMSAVKLSPNELEKNRGMTLPNYQRAEWQEVKWNMDKADDLEDTVKLPEILLNGYGTQEPGNVVVMVFNTFNQFAPLTIPNKKPSLPGERIFIDGKIIALDVNPVKGLSKSLAAAPITVTIGHVKKESALRRRLLFHTNDKEIPTVKRRYCASWDPTVQRGSNGSWSMRGCEMLVDKAEYTMCDCRHPGIFAIISQEILRKDVVPDPEWLWITKYVGYALSTLSLLLYIVIVMSSSHLKDQFHIIRVHLAVSLLIGMACLWATDYFRGHRHECTAITAGMQYSYTASGMWLLLEGFSLFLAMVCGYVGGRLKAYVPLAWGFPALPLGIAMLSDMEDFGLEKRCMVSWNDDLKWLFFGPMLASGILGLLFCIISIMNASFSKLQRDFYLEDLGSVSKGLFCVIVVFIATWSFACLAYLDIEQVDPDFYPIFQVLNSVQGLLIFGFMGLGSKKFRLVIMCKLPQYQILALQSELVPVKPQPKY